MESVASVEAGVEVLPVSVTVSAGANAPCGAVIGEAEQTYNGEAAAHVKPAGNDAGVVAGKL
jgi:hypothetical protein